MRAILISALLASALPTLAADEASSVLFARVDVGRSRVDQQRADSYGISLGQRLSRNLALEVGVRHLGQLDGAGGQRLETAAAQVNLLASLPVSDQLAVFGLLGWSRNEVRPTRDSGLASDRLRQDGLMWAAGVRWRVADQLSLYLQHSVYPKLKPATGNLQGISGRREVSSLGLGFGF